MGSGQSVGSFRAEKRSAQVLSEMHEVQTFAPCKAFLFDMFAFFSSLEKYFGFRTTNVKGKTDHSVSLRWNKRF